MSCSISTISMHQPKGSKSLQSAFEGFFAFHVAGFDGANILPMPGGAANRGGEDIAGGALNIEDEDIAGEANKGGDDIVGGDAPYADGTMGGAITGGVGVGVIVGNAIL